MALLQNKLNLRVSQKQILTPGLVQMVSVLALNKLELKDMITAEITENPVLEEVEESSVSLEEIARKEDKNERVEAADEQVTAGEKADPFDEIDFGSFFRDYLDPGYRTHSDIESLERPSFENFLSRRSQAELITKLRTDAKVERVPPVPAPTPAPAPPAKN